MEENNSYLTLNLGEEKYAIHSNYILRIIDVVKITKVPLTPDYIKGVINLDGTSVSVIDLKIKLDIPPTNELYKSIVIIELDMDDEMVKFGVLVDSVESVIEVDDKDIEMNSTTEMVGAVEGMIKNGDVFIMLLNINKLLDN